MIQKLFYPLLLFVLITNGLEAQSEDPRYDSFHSISSHDIFFYADHLSSQQYRGRLSGSPEYMAAANWVADSLKSWGLKPVGDDNSFFQWFPNPHTRVYNEGSLALHLENGRQKKYSFPESYYPGQNSASGEITADVVYVGFGITSEELGYDDYENTDVRGKIVLLESGLPVGAKHENIKEWVPYSYHQYKFSNAVRHGAVGWLYINKIANPNTNYHDEIVYAHVGEEVAKDLFEGTGINYSEHKESIVNNLVPNSVELNKKVTIKAETRHYPDTKSVNVVGLIEGSDPELKDEVIILGAHLDGVGYLGKLLPGALDNASGVADIMGAVKALANSKIQPKRSVLVLFFGGEECGLIGSNHYVKNPVFPKDKTVCLINLDMVGNGTGLIFYGGLSHPWILKHFEESNNNWLHRSFRSTEAREVVTRPRSDAAVFTMEGYKTFSMGTSGRLKPVYYHHPLDNVEGLTPEIMEDVAKLLYLGVLGLANDPNPN